MVVARQSLPAPEVHSLNPINNIEHIQHNLIIQDEHELQEARIGRNFKNYVLIL